MRNHKGTFRGFYRHTKMPWAETLPLPRDVTEKVIFGLYHPKGGTSGEMEIFWSRGGRNPAGQLHCWIDGMSALATFSDVIGRLAAYDVEGVNGNISPDEFCSLLTELGFVDRADHYK